MVSLSTKKERELTESCIRLLTVSSLLTYAYIILISLHLQFGGGRNQVIIHTHLNNKLSIDGASRENNGSVNQVVRFVNADLNSSRKTISSFEFDSRRANPLLRRKRMFRTRQYLCHTWIGRLGNQMFQYASLKSIAKKHNRTLLLTDFNILFNTFYIKNPTFHPFVTEMICNNTVSIPLKIHDYQTFVIPKSGNIRMEGYFDSWKYFFGNDVEIRREFEFEYHIEKSGQSALDEILKNHSIDGGGGGGGGGFTTVGVHIRRGDFLSEHRYTVDKNYLIKARDFFRERYKRPIFVVSTTNDNRSRGWTYDKFVVDQNDTVLLEKMDFDIHLSILSKCDHSIMTVGTFGFWSAWLSNGTVIYPKKSWKDESDLFLPQWIGITVDQ